VSYNANCSQLEVLFKVTVRSVNVITSEMMQQNMVLTQQLMGKQDAFDGACVNCRLRVLWWVRISSEEVRRSTY